MSETGETLPHKFLQHLKAQPQIIQSIIQFQSGWRPYFFVVSEDSDHTQEQRQAYLEFVKLIDEHVSNFLRLHDASEEDFVAGLECMKQAQDPHWHAFSMCLHNVEFEQFAKMMNADVCLCCGKQFGAPGHPAASVSLPAQPPPQPAGDLGPVGYADPTPPPPPPLPVDE
eukprot:TRINITY_DN77930_c0_g1_i1.p1 TRINITY_DN77930_c0_g1~~TRINITY_DN77930_c0_g1_i1.p1  ORF type:complete len:190 (-),score=31.33 TRINITY_DN77930_c0_g1_i1:170-679(-)